ncbi:MAG: hypothetical protein FGM34_07760 [Solirubrobacteraceae bacterium]|nr:hypothetical protein [Solirubrobacteraceae bacterium]
MFLGPSLERREAERIYPEAIFLPPAAVSDLINAVRRFRPHAIALIDGAFMQTMATYHKEIIDAMSQGVWVVGASSMGALRAAECDRYGMIGVGEIYEGYASGAIEDDDEVALSHLAEGFGFKPVTEAMVNIRASLAAARDAGVLTGDEAERLIELQKARWFMDRRRAASVEDAVSELGFGKERAERLRQFIQDEWVDVKSQDARLALETLRELPEGPMPEAERTPLPAAGVYMQLVDRDITVGWQDDLPVTRDQVWRYFAINNERARRVMDEVFLRMAAVDLASDLGIKATAEDRELASRKIAEDLGVETEQLADRARELDLDEKALRRWIAEEAVIAKLIRYKSNVRLGPYGIESALKVLARMGEYESNRRSAGLIESLADDSGHYEIPLGLSSAILLHAEIGGIEFPITDTEKLDRQIAELRLGDRGELYERLISQIAAHRELFDLPQIRLVPPEEELSVEREPQTSRGK